MKLVAAMAIPALLLMGQGEKSVTAVRYWSMEGVTRVAIEVSGPFSFHSDRLHNPDRVYYDILDSRMHIDSRRFYVENVGDRMLLKIRATETTPGVTRVVLDLNENVVATTSTLTTPDRLIIELRMSPGNPLRIETPPAHSSPPASVAAPSTTTPAAPAPKYSPPPPAPAHSSQPTSVAVTSAPAPAALAPKYSPPPTPVMKPIPVSLPPPPDVRVMAGTSKVVPVADPAPAGNAASPTPDMIAPSKGDPGPDEIAKAARPSSSGTNSLIRTLGLKINRVVIDPGHGGHDQGTEGTKGLLEKDVVLDVALRVGKLVQNNMGAEVIYTRSDDTFVPLEGRTALANEKKADLFLSIHANSSPYPDIAGVETYYLNITGTKDAMDVARRENGPTHDSIFDLQDLVKKIALHDKSEESHEFAKRMEASLYAFSLKNFPGSRDRGVKTAPFIVLIGANMPSVLAEIGFLTNPKEEALLKKPDYRQKLAEAIYRGMEKYTDSLSHFQAAARP